MNALTIDISDDLIERIAHRAAQILAERDTAPANGGWLRGAGEIATYLGCSTSRVYSLVSARRIPIQKDGAALIARRDDLDRWLDEGGARCP